ncbi:MAG: hypothetical protein RLZZ212_259 [Actinomycetota bacterium]
MVTHYLLHKLKVQKTQLVFLNRCSLKTQSQCMWLARVEKPGLYELPIGANAAEAIAAAGGMTADAQEASINLARTLVDGEQLYVLSQNESVQGTGKLSLNQATAEQLDSLPGIGPALSERIVAHRQSIGSFRSIEELTDVSGIGPKLFSKIRDQLTI